MIRQEPPRVRGKVQKDATVRTADEFREASKKVGYELGMLTGTVKILDAVAGTVSATVEDETIRNALIHSFLLGVRNIHEFFWGGKEDGIHARDFIQSEQWTAKQPRLRRGKYWVPADEAKAPPQGQDLITLIHTRLAHLSWRRVSEGKIHWVTRQIAAEFLVPLQTFTTKATPDRLSPKFLAAVEELEDFVCMGSRSGP